MIWSIALLLLLQVGNALDDGKFAGCDMEKENKEETFTVLAVEAEAINNFIYLRCVDFRFCGQLPVCKRTVRHQMNECKGEFSFLRKVVVSSRKRNGFLSYCCSYETIPLMEKHCRKVRVKSFHGMSEPVPKRRRLSRYRPRRRYFKRRRPRSVARQRNRIRAYRARVLKISNRLPRQDSPQITTRRKYGSSEDGAVANARRRPYIPHKYDIIKSIRQVQKPNGKPEFEVETCQLSCEFCDDDDDREDPDETRDKNNRDNEDERGRKSKQPRRGEQRGKQQSENQRGSQPTENQRGNQLPENQRGSQPEQPANGGEEAGKAAEPEAINGELEESNGGFSTGPTCLGGDMLVQTTTGLKRVHQLQLGDQVAVGGGGQFESVQWMHHFDQETLARFLVIRTADERNITVSSAHLVYSADCAVHRQSVLLGSRFVFADRIKPGSCLLSGSLEPLLVVEVREVLQRGLYAPITNAGTILVNDVLVSCFSQLEHHRLIKTAHSGLFRLRWALDKLFGPSAFPFVDGIPLLSRWLISIGNLVF